ncbi:NAD(P)-binding protein [Eremomyces bilateralis CBS 781.70]|uniref:NAD(P)-binding protein n=1 Tax=Eremomyces bilateralis CBS 781.70 TaxID=1392243 RepID=A0A6G1G9J2_9PEZI|nr:NAD(P)-binding protein [Eremomyces bilateralis CBS 781.70]KAF1814755.1 NAD(P)-binding protein [Eremomyces bilateralis CBS 781.70]
MARVLLTGGSGFIAAYLLDQLLEKGYSIVTTVRSSEKGEKILKEHAKYGKDKLDYVIVEDIAAENAFDTAVKSDPPFEAVFHTASPFHYDVTDVQKELLDPAIKGTTGILKSVKAYAPTVKRIVITSSFASLIDRSKGAWPEHTYSEADWCPLTLEEALSNPTPGYTASKTFAEKAAWAFLENEKPNFDIVTINPPAVLGPVAPWMNSLAATNTSNQRILNFIQGQAKDEIPYSGVFFWVDVRDVATAHVQALEVAEAGKKPGRFFTTAGHFSNKEIVEVIRKNFPEYKDQLPAPEAKGQGDYPAEGIYQYDNSRVREILGVKFRSLEESVVDTVKSLKAVGA